MLDGEVAIFDRQLRSRFDWLREPDPEEVATPPLLMVFDLLYQVGEQTKVPSIATLEKLAKALGVKAGRLLE
jgi:ATP-dependent DNA ligase